MIRKTDDHYGPRARNRLGETNDPSISGARAALESFYDALNNRDAAALREDWADHPLAQLNNPHHHGSIDDAEALAAYQRAVSR